MITVFEDSKNNWHLVKTMGRSGLSVSIKAYCGNETGNTIVQLPDKFLDKLCTKCQSTLHSI